LEVARTLQKLIGDQKLARPSRTVRFVFPPEIEGTMALLDARPEMAKRIKAVVHMDMVGGGPETKAVFHVTRGPMSLPSFVHDVAWAFAEWLNQESYEFAATGKANYPMVSAQGGREPLRAEYSAYTMGSDHDVYQDSSFSIPAIYLNDWPDRFIHTNLDTPANIDSTKLKRAGFIGAASGFFLANYDESNPETLFKLWTLAKRGEQQRQLLMNYRYQRVTPSELARASAEACLYETALQTQIRSAIEKLPADSPEGVVPDLPKCWTGDAPLGPADSETQGMLLRKFKRSAKLKGPMTVFGYDYFEAQWAKRAPASRPKLLGQEGLWGGGEEYGYEVLNFADGKRNVLQIQAAVSAEYGPVPVNLVLEYLQALQEMGVVEEVQ
jgi:hypothetical protein